MTVAISQYWKCTAPDGSRTAIQIASGSEQALRVFELLRSQGFQIQNISGGDYLKLCEELDAEDEAEYLEASRHHVSA